MDKRYTDTYRKGGKDGANCILRMLRNVCRGREIRIGIIKREEKGGGVPVLHWEEVRK